MDTRRTCPTRALALALVLGWLGAGCNDTGGQPTTTPPPTTQTPPPIVDPSLTPTPPTATPSPSPSATPAPTTAPPSPTSAPPTATDVPTAPLDEDGDGHAVSEDCDDADPAVHPGADELCDGIDNNCDQDIDDDDSEVTDAPTWYLDLDKDGFGNDDIATLTACEQPLGYVAEGGDCDDVDEQTYPGADESCEDEVDRNCDGSVGYVDQDQDGFAACEECDDTRTDVNPGADEVCDQADNNCDALIDDQDPALTGAPTWYADSDGDSYGDAASTLGACSQPEDFVANDDDCDDEDSALNPATVWALDADGDGYGDAGITLTQCSRPLNFTLTAGDCDDSDDAFYPGAPGERCDDPNDYNCDGAVEFSDEDEDGFAACEECDDNDEDVHPDADEVCDSRDNNCDGAVDADDDALTDGITVYTDSDEDGYGAAGTDAEVCEPGAGQVLSDDDCDDGDPALNPQTVWYLDRDADGFGDDTVTRTQCSQPTSHSRVAGDCDDLDKATYPGAVETCTDTEDRNCDGSIGAVDQDKDGFAACEDCDDSDKAVNEDAAEVCDGIDNDCDALIDDSDDDTQGEATFYRDADGDTYGAPSTTARACQAPSGYVANDDDCDDTDPAINPQTLWYPDLDGDDHGDGGGQSVKSCAQPGPLYAADGADCDDGDDDVYPGAPEGCQGDVDFNCDGAVDNDGDGDGYADAVCGGTDCDDSDPDIKPEPGGGCSLGGSCLEIRDSAYNQGSGLYVIDPDGRGTGEPPVEVWCDMVTDGGGWTLVQRTMWAWAESSKLWTNYAGWFTTTQGSPAQGKAFRVAGYYWPHLDVRAEVLVSHAVRTTDGGACQPLYYKATGTTVSATPTSSATVNIGSQAATLFNSSSLSTRDSGPDISCVENSKGVPWFYSGCCTTCPTYMGGYWSDEPHPMQSYTGSLRDLFGKLESDVCGAKLVQFQNGGSGYRGVDRMEVYLR